MFNWISSLFSSVWSLVKPAVKVLATEVGKLTLDMAIDVTASLQNDGILSSGEKREEAFCIIKDQLRWRGEVVETHIINYAIETAVQLMKSKQ